MKIAALVGSAVAMLAIAGCSVFGLSRATPSPSPLPSADITVTYADNRGTFFLGLGQTMLIRLPHAAVQYPPLLRATGHYADSTLLKAVAVGRTTVLATPATSCGVECNALAPIQITVVVVEPAELEQGVTVSKQDWYSVIHVRTGQRFVLALPNPASGPAWTAITPDDPAVIVADQPPTPSQSGIRGQFHGGHPGSTLVRVTVCPTGSACPTSDTTSSRFVVFA